VIEICRAYLEKSTQSASAYVYLCGAKRDVEVCSRSGSSLHKLQDQSDHYSKRPPAPHLASEILDIAEMRGSADRLRQCFHFYPSDSLSLLVSLQRKMPTRVTMNEAKGYRRIPTLDTELQPSQSERNGIQPSYLFWPQRFSPHLAIYAFLLLSNLASLYLWLRPYADSTCIRPQLIFCMTVLFPPFVIQCLCLQY